MDELGILLGVRFETDSTGVNGFVLRLTNDETEEVLFQNRMIFYTLWEAVIKACNEVWAEEMEKHQDWELPNRIATALGIPETYEEEDDE